MSVLRLYPLRDWEKMTPALPEFDWLVQKVTDRELTILLLQFSSQAVPVPDEAE